MGQIPLAAVGISAIQPVVMMTSSLVMSFLLVTTAPLLNRVPGSLKWSRTSLMTKLLMSVIRALLMTRRPPRTNPQSRAHQQLVHSPHQTSTIVQMTLGVTRRRTVPNKGMTNRTTRDPNRPPRRMTRAEVVLPQGTIQQSMRTFRSPLRSKNCLTTSEGTNPRLLSCSPVSNPLFQTIFLLWVRLMLSSRSNALMGSRTPLVSPSWMNPAPFKLMALCWIFSFERSPNTPTCSRWQLPRSRTQQTTPKQLQRGFSPSTSFTVRSHHPTSTTRAQCLTLRH
mmetsp:Transcript_50/g.141  ORF Transcript_50/g.141 Transcript_50/m.141 type:complete len:281 (-) Transcript_50:311-1153(-)